MTIVIGLAAPDGIVLAADSRTTRFPDGVAEDARHRIVSDSADKLFAACERYAVATYGAAFIGEKTIRGHMDEFIAHLGDEHPEDVGRFARALGRFFQDRYLPWRESIGQPVKDDEGVQLGFLVAGYDEDGIGHLLEVFIPGARVVAHSTTSTRGLLPRGDPRVINRLLTGIDWHELPHDFTLPDEAVDALNGLEYRLLMPITLQDAIDFVRFLIRTTIDMQRFSDGIRANPRGGGVPSCGGPTKIAAVKRTGVQLVASTPLSAKRPSGVAEGALTSAVA